MRNITHVIDHLIKYEGVDPESVRDLLRRATYHSPEAQSQDWRELAIILMEMFGEPDPRDKSWRIAKIMSGEILIPVKDVPVGRLFKVWQTGTTYCLVAKDCNDGTILAQDDAGGFYQNENLAQLVELLADEKGEDEKPNERY